MEPERSSVSPMYARAFSNRFRALENLDALGGICRPTQGRLLSAPPVFTRPLSTHHTAPPFTTGTTISGRADEIRTWARPANRASTRIRVLASSSASTSSKTTTGLDPAAARAPPVPPAAAPPPAASFARRRASRAGVPPTEMARSWRCGPTLVRRCWASTLRIRAKADRMRVPSCVASGPPSPSSA